MLQMDNTTCPEATEMRGKLMGGYCFSRPICDIADSNLPAVTASLEMLTVNANLSASPGKRVLRKRIAKSMASENLNRRCSLRPKKRICSEMEEDGEIKDYYLDKNIKKAQNNLETIYEEKEGISDTARFMSSKRYKRMIQFQNIVSDSKIKKRRAKIKKAFGSKVFFKKLSNVRSMKELLEKLNGMRVVIDDTSATTANKV